MHARDTPRDRWMLSSSNAEASQQAETAELLVAAAQEIDGICEIHLRGSLAKGRADAWSDIDLVIFVQDNVYRHAVEAVDRLIAATLSPILPRWRDSFLSAGRDGLGYVYLLQRAAAVVQLDLYLACASQIDSVARRLDSHLMIRLARASSRTVPAGTVAELRRESSRPAEVPERVAEVLILGHMLAKHVARRDRFLRHANFTLLCTAARDLVLATTGPRSTWGWYGLEERNGHLGEALADLADLVALPAPSTASDVRTAMTLVERMAARTFPTMTPKELLAFSLCREHRERLAGLERHDG